MPPLAFQVKINCSKYNTWILTTVPHDFLVSLFAKSSNLLFGVFLPKKIVTILGKTAAKHH